MVVGEVVTDRRWAPPADELIGVAGYPHQMTDSQLSANLPAELRRRQTDVALVAVLDTLADTTPMVVASSARGPLALSASAGSYAAVYVWKHRFSVAVEPDDGQRLHTRYGVTVEAKNASTHYVQFPSDDLARPGIREVVLDTMTAAFARPVAATPPRVRRTPSPPVSTTRSTREVSRGEVCPIHFVEKSVSGICPVCDD